MPSSCSLAELIMVQPKCQLISPCCKDCSSAMSASLSAASEVLKPPVEIVNANFAAAVAIKEGYSVVLIHMEQNPSLQLLQHQQLCKQGLALKTQGSSCLMRRLYSCPGLVSLNAHRRLQQLLKTASCAPSITSAQHQQTQAVSRPSSYGHCWLTCTASKPLCAECPTSFLRLSNTTAAYKHFILDECMNPQFHFELPSLRAAVLLLPKRLFRSLKRPSLSWSSICFQQALATKSVHLQGK